MTQIEAELVGVDSSIDSGLIVGVGSGSDSAAEVGIGAEPAIGDGEESVVVSNSDSVSASAAGNSVDVGVGSWVGTLNGCIVVPRPDGGTVFEAAVAEKTLINTNVISAAIVSRSSVDMFIIAMLSRRPGCWLSPHPRRVRTQHPARANDTQSRSRR